MWIYYFALSEKNREAKKLCVLLFDVKVYGCQTEPLESITDSRGYFLLDTLLIYDFTGTTTLLVVCGKLTTFAPVAVADDKVKDNPMF